MHLTSLLSILLAKNIGSLSDSRSTTLWSYVYLEVMVCTYPFPFYIFPSFSFVSVFLSNIRNVDCKPTHLGESAEDVERILSHLYERVSSTWNDISAREVGDALQRAAALLCSSSDDHPLVIHYLVSLPFRIFSKGSIQLGISLWLGVMHENPRTGPRILVEVMECWERTVEHKKGLFDATFE